MNNDVISTQILLMLFRANSSEASLRFRALAQASEIFDNLNSPFPALLSSASGICQPTSPSADATYNSADMVLTATFPTGSEPTDDGSYGSTTTGLGYGDGKYEFCPDQLSVRNFTLGIPFSESGEVSINMAHSWWPLRLISASLALKL